MEIRNRDGKTAKDLENELFILQMKDHYNNDDFMKESRLNQEIRYLKQKEAELKKEEENNGSV